MRRIHRDRSERLTATVLARLPLPDPAADGDKEARGCVLVVGGDAGLPGAVILAGEAALRVGAGKLQLGTAPGHAVAVGAAVPEAAVHGIRLDRAGWRRVGALAANARAVVLGPGLDEPAAADVLRLLRGLDGDQTLVLDAGALTTLATRRAALRAITASIVITPHAGEMATFLGVTKEAVQADALAIAARTARELGCVVVLKGRDTVITDGARTLVNDRGNVGLATSGSGDVLAGLVGGLAARGAMPLVAAAWAVNLHARAGEVLARRRGVLGYLARELAVEVPALMRRRAR